MHWIWEIFFLLGLCLSNISRGQVFKLQRQLSSSWLQSTSVSFMPDLNLDQPLNVLFLSALLGTAFRDKEEKCGSRGMIHRLKSPPTTRPQVYPEFVHYVNSGPSFTSQGHWHSQKMVDFTNEYIKEGTGATVFIKNIPSSWENKTTPPPKKAQWNYYQPQS